MVVCCARDDADSLQEALGSLRDEGHDIELVEGVDADPKNLGETIDRLQGEGLYVLCRSPRLGRERVEELREILLARQIPFARTLTIAVGGRGGLADRIRSGLRRASARGGGGITRTKSTRSASPTPSPPAQSKPAPATTPVTRQSSTPLAPISAQDDDEPTLVGMRDDIPGLPELSATSPMPKLPGSAPSPAPTPAAPDPAPFEAAKQNSRPLLTGVPPSAENSDAAPEDDNEQTLENAEAALENVDEALAALEAGGEEEWPDEDTNVTEDPSASTSTAELSASDLDLSDLDNSVAKAPSGVDTTAVGTPPPLITGNTVIGPAPVMITGNTVVGKRLSDLVPVPGGSPWPPRSDAGSAGKGPLGEAEPTTEPFARLDAPSASPPPLPPSPSQPMAVAPSGPLSVPPSGPLDVPPSAALNVPPPAAPMASPAMAPPLDEPITPPSRTLPLVLGGVALLLLVLVVALAVWPDDEDTDEVATRDAEAEQAAKLKAANEAKARAEQEAAEKKANEPPPPPPEYAVVNALEARRVRALDVLLMATDTSKPSDFVSASSYCQQLDIDGLQGWRLPAVGELSSLSKANMIGRRGYFWSSTAADTFGDDHLAWNVRRGYAESRDKDATAVCVRGGVSGS